MSDKWLQTWDLFLRQWCYTQKMWGAQNINFFVMLLYVCEPMLKKLCKCLRPDFTLSL